MAEALSISTPPDDGTDILDAFPNITCMPKYDKTNVLEVSPDGKKLFLISGIYGVVRLWDVAPPGENWPSLRVCTAGVDVIAFSPDGNIASISSLGGIWIWNTEPDARPIRQVGQDTHDCTGPRGLVFSPEWK